MNKDDLIIKIESIIEDKLDNIASDIKEEVLDSYVDYIMDDIGDVLYSDEIESPVNTNQLLNDMIKTVNKLQNMNGNEVGTISAALERIGLQLGSIHKAHGVYQIEAVKR